MTEKTFDLHAILARKMICPDHPRYKGLRKPRTDCAQCWAIYRMRQASGVKERRIRERGRGDGYKASWDVSLVKASLTDRRAEKDLEKDQIFGSLIKALVEKNYRKRIGEV